VTESGEDIGDRGRLAISAPLLRFLGAELVEDEDTQAVAFSVEDNALNAIGGLHGGAIAIVLETAAYLAVVQELEPHEEATTHSFAASYLAPPERGERLRATGVLLRRTRRLAFVNAELRGRSGLLAVASVSKTIHARRRD
jgi:uncharacterized protein (TIGR00369 family)